MTIPLYYQNICWAPLRSEKDLHIYREFGEFQSFAERNEALMIWFWEWSALSLYSFHHEVNSNNHIFPTDGINNKTSNKAVEWISTRIKATIPTVFTPRSWASSFAGSSLAFWLFRAFFIISITAMGPAFRVSTVSFSRDRATTTYKGGIRECKT